MCLPPGYKKQFTHSVILLSDFIIRLLRYLLLIKLMGVALVVKRVSKGDQGNTVLVVHLTV